MNAVSATKSDIAGKPTLITSFSAVFIPTAAIAERSAHRETSAAIKFKELEKAPNELRVTSTQKATTNPGISGGFFAEC